MKNRAFVVVGPPGSGKGTLCRALSASKSFFHCSCGDVFRSLNCDGRLAEIFRSYSSRGLLVPDDITVEVWQEHMMRCKKEGRFRAETQVILLDGIPRNSNQAMQMSRLLDVLGVIQLDHIGQGDLVERIRRRALKEGRADDANETVIQQRLNLYQQETEALLACYPGDRICKLDATKPPGEVLRDAACNLIRFL